jgi:hypothetical protein
VERFGDRWYRSGEMPQIDVPVDRLRFGQTSRTDRWCVVPVVVFTILTSFIVYATWAAMQNAHYTYGPYLSPFYSPLWLGDWGPLSPALIILPFPAGFRLTCYYYRGAYYKAFWADPIACAVGEPRNEYRGEQKWPLLVQNVHRYFLYAAVVFIFFLSYDAYEGFFGWPDGFHMNLGSLVLLANVCLLASYTFGCHSFRHLVGGAKDILSRHKARRAAYNCSSYLNARHMRFAWLSLFCVAFSDIYVRLCSMGTLHDYRIF